MSELQEPPKTVKEVGIHLFYLGQNVERLTDLVEKLQSGFVTKEDYDAYKILVDARFKELAKRTWVQNLMSGVAGSLVSALVTYIVLGLIHK